MRGFFCVWGYEGDFSAGLIILCDEGILVPYGARRPDPRHPGPPGQDGRPDPTCE